MNKEGSATSVAAVEIPGQEPPVSEDVNQVFSLLKSYLEDRLEQKGREISTKQKAELRAERFKSKGNQKQFQFNAELADIVEKAKEDFASKE